MREVEYTPLPCSSRESNGTTQQYFLLGAHAAMMPFIWTATLERFGGLYTRRILAPSASYRASTDKYTVFASVFLVQRATLCRMLPVSKNPPFPWALMAPSECPTPFDPQTRIAPMALAHHRLSRDWGCSGQRWMNYTSFSFQCPCGKRSCRPSAATVHLAAPPCHA